LNGPNEVSQPSAVNPGGGSNALQEIPPPPGKPWGGWATIGLGAAVLAVYFVAQAGVAVVYSLWKVLSNPESDITSLVNGLTSDGLLISLATILSGAVGTGFIVLFIKLRKSQGLGQYLALKPLSRKTIVSLAAILVLLLAASIALSSVWSQIEDSGFTVDAFKTSIWPPLFGLAVVIFAPLFEETFFRGFLFRGLESPLGVAGTILLTSLLWALLHVQYNGYGMLQIFVLGIVFGSVRWKTRSLWAPLSLHAFWNLAAVISAAIAARG
jgi:membrane protease YdiL (CAAX protease family)